MQLEVVWFGVTQPADVLKNLVDIPLVPFSVYLIPSPGIESNVRFIYSGLYYLEYPINKHC